MCVCVYLSGERIMIIAREKSNNLTEGSGWKMWRMEIYSQIENYSEIIKVRVINMTGQKQKIFSGYHSIVRN